MTEFVGWQAGRIKYQKTVIASVVKQSVELTKEYLNAFPVSENIGLRNPDSCLEMTEFVDFWLH